MPIGGEIARGIGHAQGRFAEHVIGVAIAALFGRSGVGQCLTDAATHDELLTEQAHRGAHGLTDQWFAGACEQAFAGASEGFIAVLETDESTGQHQCPV